MEENSGVVITNSSLNVLDRDTPENELLLTIIKKPSYGQCLIFSIPLHMPLLHSPVCHSFMASLQQTSIICHITAPSGTCVADWCSCHCTSAADWRAGGKAATHKASLVKLLWMDVKVFTAVLLVVASEKWSWQNWNTVPVSECYDSSAGSTKNHIEWTLEVKCTFIWKCEAKRCLFIL